MRKITLILLGMMLFASSSVFSRAFDGTEKMFLKPLAISWWLNDNAKVGFYFFNSEDGNDENAWAEVTHIVGAEADVNQIWGAVVPEGDWTHVIVTRHNPDKSDLNWDEDNLWNQSGDIFIPDNGNYIESFAENSTDATWQTLTYTFGTKNTGNWDDTTTWDATFDESNWFGSEIATGAPVSKHIIRSAHQVTLSSDTSAVEVEVEPNGKLTVSTETTLTVTDQISLLSDATGTATLVGDVTGNATAYQYLTPLRNWYMSSPMSAAAIPTDYDPPSAIEYYDETETSTTPSDRWVVVNSGNFTVGKGYVVYPGVDGGGYSFEFSGTLNSGNQSITLTRTTTKTSEVGFNLVGNPYPSYLNANALLNDASNSEVLKTIWYRTKDGTNYQFNTFNAESGIGVPTNNLGLIPPMQGFWVRATSDNVPLNFTDAMRLHNTTGNNIPFKAPKVDVNQILRLQLSNGTASDETIIYFNPNAQDAYDSFDSPKMMNNGTTVPNIFTRLGAEDLVINGMNTIPYDTRIPLFVKGNAGQYTISVSEFSNFSTGEKAVLIDNKTSLEVDLSLENYTFTISEGDITENRFSVMFPKSGMPTSVDRHSAKNILATVNGNTMSVFANENEIDNEISIFNSVGQRVITQKVNGLKNDINAQFQTGIYIVKLNNRTAKVFVK